MGKTIECRSEEGLIIGLIDSIMTISSVLRKSLYKEINRRKTLEDKNKDIDRGEYGYGIPIEDALKDLRDYEPLYLLLQQLGFNRRILTEEDRLMMEMVDKTIKLLKEKEFKIDLNG